MNSFEHGQEFALKMDLADPLRRFREEFLIPLQSNGNPYLYFCGNSLGLQPKKAANEINRELDDWKSLAVEAHFRTDTPWMTYHELLTSSMAKVVGAKPKEVVVMNTLSVNLHLMMVSFYQPTKQRYKILIEYDAFPSDKFAMASQIDFHGFDAADALIEMKPRAGEHCLRMEDIKQVLDEQGQEIALVLLGNTNYYTGQFFDMKTIAAWGHKQGCMVAFDCAHGAGNVPLNLHDSNIDFAVWCTYKYLNSGPGSIGGCFVHERHAVDLNRPRFAGWWGHNKETRFQMRDDFDPTEGAEGWQLSNPPIMAMAPIKASLEVFMEAGMDNLFAKSKKLTGYLEFLIKEMNNDSITIITPGNPNERGCQLSLQFADQTKSLFDAISEKGVIADWREPNVIRIAPTPLYNSFEDVWSFVEILKNQL